MQRSARLLSLLRVDKCLFEVQHIQRPGGMRRSWSPLDPLPIGIQEGVSVWQGTPQASQQRAEIGVRLGLCGIGPQQGGEVHARLAGVTMEHQVG